MPPVLTPAVFFAAFVGTCVVVVPVAMYASSSAPPSPPQPTAPPDPVKCTGHMFSNEEPELEDVSDLFIINNESRVQLNVPPRYMWGWGGTVRGYCGAGSLQSSALYFGTWISQQYPRWAAGNDSSPAYLGKAAQTFRLTVDNFDTKLLPNPQADIFLQWTQAHILLGHVVIGGLYAKFHRSFTDLEFDHIVPIIGVTMDDDEFQYADDDSGKINITTNVTGVLYNDLDDQDYRRMHSPLAALRADFIVPENISNVFPIKYAIPEYADFGLAVTGVMDTFGETYRTKLTPWSWTEPDWGTEDGCNETAEEMFVSISVYGLTPGRVYSILRFEGNTSIPTSNFLGSRNYTKRWNFVARSSTYVQSPLDTIMTDLLVSYRTVLSDVQNLTRTRSQSKTRSASRMLTITPEVTKSITKINSPPDNATKAPPPSRGAVRGSFWLQGARGRLITHRNTNTPDDRSPQQPPSEPDVMVACAELAVCVVAAAFFVVRRYRWTRTAYHTWFKTNGRNAPSSPSSAAFDLA